MVFAYLVTLKLRRTEDVATFLRLFEPLHTYCNTKEHGTLTYEVLRSESCDRTIIILERYRTVADLEVAHRSSEAFKEFCVELTKLDMIEEKVNGRWMSDLLPPVHSIPKAEVVPVERTGPPFRGALVFCGAREGVKPIYMAEGARLGTLLAERGIPLVYGGGTCGIMGSVALAVQKLNGKIVSIIPRALLPREVSGESLGELFVTNTMAERKSLMFGMADIVIALPGGIGTFDELLEVLTLYQLNAYRPRIGLLNVEGYFDPLLAMLRHMVTEGFLNESVFTYFVVAPSAEAVLEGLLSNDFVLAPSDCVASWGCKP